MNLCSRAREPRLLSPCATTPALSLPRVHPLQQEKPPQWETRALKLGSGPHSLQPERGPRSKEDPTQADINKELRGTLILEATINSLLFLLPQGPKDPGSLPSFYGKALSQEESDIMLCLQPFLYLNASPPVNLVPHYRVTMEFLITVNLLNVIKSHPGMISISSLSLSHLSLHWHLHCELLFQLWNSNIYSAHTKCQC